MKWRQDSRLKIKWTCPIIIISMFYVLIGLVSSGEREAFRWVICTLTHFEPTWALTSQSARVNLIWKYLLSSFFRWFFLLRDLCFSAQWKTDWFDGGQSDTKEKETNSKFRRRASLTGRDLCVCVLLEHVNKEIKTLVTRLKENTHEIFLYDRNAYNSIVLSCNSVAKSYLSKSYLTSRKI